MTKTRKPWKRAGLDEVAGGVDDGDRDSCVRKETERSAVLAGSDCGLGSERDDASGVLSIARAERGVVLLVETSTEGTRSG